MSITTNIDKERLKAIAVGHWHTIIADCSGLSTEQLLQKSSPCPLICNGAGDDRYSAFDDFEATGGTNCRHCGSNPDGFATLAKARGKEVAGRDEFADVAGWLIEKRIATEQSLKDESQTTAGRTNPFDKIESPREPSIEISNSPASKDHGEFQFPKPNAQKPVFKTAVDAIRAVLRGLCSAGTLKAWRSPEHHFCYGYDGNTLAFVVLRWNLSEDERKNNGKTKIIRQICQVEGGWQCSGLKSGVRSLYGLWPRDLERGFSVPDVSCAETVLITEGEPACEALLKIGLNAVSPAGGAQAPGKTDWRPLNGKRVIVLPDSDEPGEAFARRVVELLHEQAPNSKIEVHRLADDPEFPAKLGDDAVDWCEHFSHLSPGDLRKRLTSLPNRSGQFREKHIVLSNGLRGDGGVDAFPLTKISTTLNEHTNGWPKVCAGRLFHYNSAEDKVRTLSRVPQLFAWIGEQLGAPTDFARNSNCHGREEFFEHLISSQESFEAIELAPHEPSVPAIYYAHLKLPETNGQHFEWLLNRFSVASENDRQLVAALFLTAAWGGPAGERPIFLITADGHGAGKSTLAKIVAELFGGAIDVQPQEKLKELKERLLSPEGRRSRLALIDNMKGFRISNAELEALITSSRISGREMYVGESNRPNLLTWIMTSNSPGLSRDLAQRVVNIQLKRASYAAAWSSHTFAYVQEHKWEIIADIVRLLRAGRSDLENHSRWSKWESDILGRLRNGTELQKLIIDRQRALDCDGAESDDLDDFIYGRLSELMYSPDSDSVFIPGLVMAKWYAEATGERCSTTKATQSIKRNIVDGLTEKLQQHRTMGARGFLWTGNGISDVQGAHFDLEDRIQHRNRRNRWPGSTDDSSWPQ